MARVNTNLDWRYEREEGIYRWIKDDKSIVMYKKEGIWRVKCKIIVEFEQSFEKFSQGFRYIRKIIKEDN